MSQITRCPACGTLFRVVPDQLKISEGWVRCGQCDEIFDATAHIQTPVPPPPSHPLDALITQPPPASAPGVSVSPPPPAPPAASPVAPPVAPPAPAPDPVPATPSGGAALQPPEAPPVPPPSGVRSAESRWPSHVSIEESLTADTVPMALEALQDLERPTVIPSEYPPDSQPPLDDAVQAEVQAWAATMRQRDPGPSTLPQPGPDSVRDFSHSVRESSRDSGFAPAMDPQPSPAPPPRAGGELPDPFDGPGVTLEDADLSFVQAAKPKAFWRRSGVRLVLLLIVLLVLTGLALQAVITERHRIVVAQPGLRPALTWLCKSLGCSLAAPQQIDVVVIDNSAFSKLKADTFRLSFTVRNLSEIEVATPAVELTLTDIQGQPVMRKVFKPVEVGGPAALQPKTDWNAVLSLNVDTPEVAGRVSGYRLWAFYP